MSESNGTSAWVGDLDCCVSYVFDPPDEIDYEREADELEVGEVSDLIVQEPQEIKLDEVGHIALLAGKTITRQSLYEKNIGDSELRQALHQAEMTIGFNSEQELQYSLPGIDCPVTRFVKGMSDLGRSYAIARYAHWEHLDYPSALTATLPHGIRALVNQLLASEGIQRNRDVDSSIQAVLRPSEKEEMIAYHRTGQLQAALHQIADQSPSHSGSKNLDRNRMRTILALARLYFSTIELRVASVEELRSLLRNYEAERAIAQQDEARIKTGKRFIRAWRLRHVRPLLDLYPYSIRHGLKRALAHGATSFDRTVLVNELALAHCGIFIMRSAWKANKPKK